MKKVLLTIILACSFLFGNTNLENDIKNVLSNIDKKMSLYKDKNELKKERNDEVFNIIEPIIHFELMAKLSVGSDWRNFSENEKNEFTISYIEKMKRSIADKLDMFNSEVINIVGAEQIKKDRIIVKSVIKTKGDDLTLDFKMYKPKETIQNKNEWLVYDIIISGVSFISSDRAQYSGFLKTKSPRELIDLMKSKEI